MKIQYKYTFNEVILKFPYSSFLQNYFIKGLFIPKVHTYVGEFRTEYVQFPVGSSVDILDSLSQGPDVWRRPVVGLEEAEELEFEERAMNVGGRSLVTGY